MGEGEESVWYKNGMTTCTYPGKLYQYVLTSNAFPDAVKSRAKLRGSFSEVFHEIGQFLVAVIPELQTQDAVHHEKYHELLGKTHDIERDEANLFLFC